MTSPSQANESAVSPRRADRLKLTDTTIADLQCPPGRKDVLVFDANEPGFGVRVTTDGKRVMLFQYRAGTAVRRYRIGVWGQGDLTAAKARREAEKLRGRVHAGEDPVAARKDSRTATVAAEKAERAAATVEAFTFGKLVDGWESKGLAHRRPSYAQDATTRLRTYFAAWSNLPAADITRADALKVLDQVEKARGVISARRGLAYGRAAYGWAEKRDLVAGNPFRGIAAPGKETARERVLTAAELQAIWQAACAMEGAAGAYVRVLLLTLQRREEVAGMKWTELAADRSTWTIPAERAKNGKAHLVHLSDPARAALAGLPRVKGNPYVFAGRRSAHIGGFSHIKDELLRVMAGAPPVQRGRRRAAKPDSVASSWRFHDFRRTGVTMLANMGVAPHVADKLLNHITGSIQGVAAVYQRAEFLAERKAALEAWAGFICGEGKTPTLA